MALHWRSSLPPPLYPAAQYVHDFRVFYNLYSFIPLIELQKFDNHPVVRLLYYTRHNKFKFIATKPGGHGLLINVEFDGSVVDKCCNVMPPRKRGGRIYPYKIVAPIEVQETSIYNRIADTLPETVKDLIANQITQPLKLFYMGEDRYMFFVMNGTSIDEAIATTEYVARYPFFSDETPVAVITPTRRIYPFQIDQNNIEVDDMKVFSLVYSKAMKTDLEVLDRYPIVRLLYVGKDLFMINATKPGSELIQYIPIPFLATYPLPETNLVEKNGVPGERLYPKNVSAPILINSNCSLTTTTFIGKLLNDQIGAYLKVNRYEHLECYYMGQNRFMIYVINNNGSFVQGVLTPPYIAVYPIPKTPEDENNLGEEVIVEKTMSLFEILKQMWKGKV